METKDINKLFLSKGFTAGELQLLEPLINSLSDILSDEQNTKVIKILVEMRDKLKNEYPNTLGLIIRKSAPKRPIFQSLNIFFPIRKKTKTENAKKAKVNLCLSK